MHSYKTPASDSYSHSVHYL